MIKFQANHTKVGVKAAHPEFTVLLTERTGLTTAVYAAVAARAFLQEELASQLSAVEAGVEPVTT
jgi:hypothetical protein